MFYSNNIIHIFATFFTTVLVKRLQLKKLVCASNRAI